MKNVPIVVGTNGYGFALCSPSLANDTTQVYCSTVTSTWNGGASPIDATTYSDGTVLKAVCSNLPYSSGNFAQSSYTTPLIAGRIISAEMRITYTGTVSNMGGVIACYTSPDHTNLNPTSYTALSNYAEAVVGRVSNRPCQLVISAIDEAETEYQNQTTNNTSIIFPFQGGAANNSLSGSFTTVGPVIAGAYIQAPAGATFLLEYWVNIEYIGPSANTKMTPNQVDRPAFEAVMSAAASVPLKQQASGVSYAQAMKSGFAEAMESVSSFNNAYPQVSKKLGSAAIDWVMKTTLPASARGSLRINN